MIVLSVFFLLAALISLILASLALTISKKNNKDQEKLSPFECGFDPLKKARVPFSLRFFLVTVIFLIFDVEVVILLPLGLISSISVTPDLFMLASVITLILVLGLAHEWNQGGLNWL